MDIMVTQRPYLTLGLTLSVIGSMGSDSPRFLTGEFQGDLEGIR